MSGTVFGPPGYAIAAAASLLWLAWRHDNNAGSYLTFAVLFLITIGVMLVIFFLLLVIHPR